MLDGTNSHVDENEEIIKEAVQEVAIAVVGPQSLNEESKALINQIIAETDEQKVRDLTHLFNANQNKKTMARVNKLSDLLDTITDQALTRFTARPDEISLSFDLLKTAMIAITTVKTTPSAPFII